MRIALCLSGQPRCLVECLPSLRRYIIQPFNADVFFHFWRTSDATQSPAINEIWYGKKEPNWYQFRDECVGWLKPKQYIAEPQEYFDDSFYRYRCTTANSKMQAKSFQNVLSMFTSINKVFDILEYHVGNYETDYDAVIRCRTDLLFYNTPDLDNMDLNFIHIPGHDSYGGLNDQFAIGSHLNMDIYSDCIFNIPRLFNDGTNFHPETILRDHLKLEQVNVKQMSQCYKLVR